MAHQKLEIERAADAMIDLNSLIQSRIDDPEVHMAAKVASYHIENAFKYQRMADSMLRYGRVNDYLADRLFNNEPPTPIKAKG